MLAQLALVYLFTLTAAQEECAVSLLQHDGHLLKDYIQRHDVADLRENGHTEEYRHSSSSSSSTGGKSSANSSVGVSSPLVLMTVPHNFGDTIAGVAEARTAGALLWGTKIPALHVEGEMTHCDWFHTPQKHWPEDLARQYFGNATVFGLLRDPYERLVSLFRSDIHGGRFPAALRNACDVNAAVKHVLKDYMSGNDTFKLDCTWMPQAEYFGGPYGISVPIDARRFPTSVNEVLVAHGYDYLYIKEADVIHVSGCDDLWAGDLDAEARHLVQTVYKRDFDLICQLFGHCDVNEIVCSREIRQMCPEKAFRWDAAAKSYVPL